MTNPESTRVEERLSYQQAREISLRVIEILKGKLSQKIRTTNMKILDGGKGDSDYMEIEEQGQKLYLEGFGIYAALPFQIEKMGVFGNDISLRIARLSDQKEKNASILLRVFSPTDFLLRYSSSSTSGMETTRSTGEMIVQFAENL